MNPITDKNILTPISLLITQVQRRARSYILERGSNSIHGDEIQYKHLKEWVSHQNVPRKPAT